MKTVIITGGGGFLGSHLAEAHVRNGFNVIAVDNFCTGHPHNREILQALGTRVKLIETDVTSEWTWLNQISDDWLKSLTHIFHFASPASPPHYQRLSLETIAVNTIGLENALKTADKFGARTIFASTSEIYGDPQISPQPESYWGNVNTFGERSCYDEAKRLGETLVFAYNKRNNTQHGLVRIFNTYGPRMNPNDGRVVINFITQALSNEPLTIYGDGSQTRSFCFVADLIEGIISYANSNLTQPMNIGNDKEFTILELAQVVNMVTGNRERTYEFRNLPSDDPKIRRPDLTFARKEFPNWRPKIELEEGVRIMKDWLITLN